MHTLPEDQRKCAVCGGTLVPFSKEYVTARLCMIPAKIFKITYFREVYKCEHCDKHGDKANIVKAPNLTPVAVIPRGLPEAEMIAYIAEAKYLLGEPLYRNDKNSKAAKVVEISDRAFVLEREVRKANYSPKKAPENAEKRGKPNH